MRPLIRAWAIGMALAVFAGPAVALHAVPIWQDTCEVGNAGWIPGGRVVTASDGNPIVVGGAFSGDLYGLAVRKLDRQTGTELWSHQTLAAPGWTAIIVEAVLDGDDDLIVAGNFRPDFNGEIGAKIVTLKLDGDTGDLIWSSGYPGTEYSVEVTVGLALDSSGDVFLVGIREHALTTYDCLAFKLDGSDGALLWEATPVGSVLYDFGSCVVIGADGDPVFAGTVQVASGLVNCFTTKLGSSDGSVLWYREEPGAAANEPGVCHLAALPGGDVVMCNRTPYGVDRRPRMVWRRYGGGDGSIVWISKWTSAPMPSKTRRS